MFDRLRQVGLLLRRHDPVATPSALSRMPATARLFRALALHDQRHLKAVHDACLRAGLSRDLAMAGLLHDIGKASLSGRRVTLADRSLRVVLARASTPLLHRLCREPAPGWRLGLLLAEQHGRLGASRLDALGWPVEITAAVRDHDLEPVPSALAALRRIDDTTP